MKIPLSVVFGPARVLGLPPLKKLKAGGLEAEFDEAITTFEEKVVAAETETQTKPTREVHVLPPMKETYVSEYNRILSAPTSKTEKIVAAAILVERMLRETAKELALPSADNRRPARQLVAELAHQGFLTPVEQAAFDEFWIIRNTVVHGELAVTDAQAARVLDLVWRLVRTLA